MAPRRAACHANSSWIDVPLPRVMSHKLNRTLAVIHLCWMGGYVSETIFNSDDRQPTVGNRTTQPLGDLRFRTCPPTAAVKKNHCRNRHFTFGEINIELLRWMIIGVSDVRMGRSSTRLRKDFAREPCDNTESQHDDEITHQRDQRSRKAWATQSRKEILV